MDKEEIRAIIDMITGLGESAQEGLIYYLVYLFSGTVLAYSFWVFAFIITTRFATKIFISNTTNAETTKILYSLYELSSLNSPANNTHLSNYEVGKLKKWIAEQSLKEE